MIFTGTVTTRLFVIIPTLVLFITCGIHWFKNSYTSSRNPRVCVIGAGVAGLASARYLKEANIDFTVLEATEYVGGTWRYEPRVKQDEYGLPIYTSMYKNLRTNLPVPAMEFPGFPCPKSFPSYPGWEQYYKYLKAFARHFDLKKHIQFLHQVTSVRRFDEVWKVRHRNVATGDVFEEDYDYVFVGSGHFHKPQLPDIPKQDIFNGSVIHSHDYRHPEVYRDRRVLVVGAGPSGMDIGLNVAAISRTLVHSQHSKIEFNTPFPSNYIKKPDVKEYTPNGVIFVDGSFEEIDDVIYCTGFEYHYPFLDESSELTITPQSISPLYRYMVNVNQPTMLIMGAVQRACIVIALDAQARYATALVKGNFSLPPRASMLSEWQKQVDSIISKGKKLSFLHVLAYDEDKYYADLTEESGIERVPTVLFEIRTADMAAKLENLYTYRDYEYIVLDKDHFIRRLVNETENKNCTT